MDIIDRSTRDFDFIDPELKNDFLDLANQFKEENVDLDLPDEWINNGPRSLKSDLPKEWEKRLRLIFQGQSIQLFTLGKSDLLKSKLFAYCDRDIDLQDCIALNPSEVELSESMEWLLARDANPMWPERVKIQIEFLKKQLKR